MNKLKILIIVLLSSLFFGGIAYAAPGVVYQSNSLLPTQTDTFDLGTTSKEWNGGYFKNVTVSGTCTNCGGSGSLTGGTAGMLPAWVTASTLTSTSGPTASFFYATSTSATSTFNGLLIIRPNANGVDPLYIGTSTTGYPIFGPVQGDMIDVENNFNGITNIGVTNDNQGTCAGEGIFANGNIPVLSNNYSFMGFLNTGWTGSGCAVGNGKESPLDAVLTNPTGGLDFELSSTTAVNFEFYGTNNVQVATLSNTTGNFGLSTTSPGSRLSVQGNVFIAGNITSTSSVANVFPYASSTAHTSGAWFGGGLSLCTGSQFLQYTATTGQFSCATPTGGSGLSWMFGSLNDYGTTTVSTTTSIYTVGSFFSSSTQASQFPYASTTAISASNLTSGNCVQASTGGFLTTTGSPCGSGGSGAAYSFTPTTYNGNQVSATTTGIFANVALPAYGFIASSTFFTYASTSVITSDTASTTNLNISGQTTFQYLTSGAAKFLDISAAGVVASLAIPLSEPNGGTNRSSVFPASMLIAQNGAGTALEPTSTPTADHYLATSTNASIFPYASTTAISASNLTSGNCVQASTGGFLTTTGSACGSGGGGAYPFTPALNFGALTNATTGIVWFQNGLQASSTIHTQNIDIDQFSNIQFYGTTTISASSTIYSTIFGIGAAPNLINVSTSTTLAPLTYGNTAIGYFALNQATSSPGNTAIGDGALWGSAIGTFSIIGQNTAVGYWALASSTSGNSNVAVGYQAGQRLTTGVNDAFFGWESAHSSSLTTASNDTGIGYNTLQNLTTGGQNTTIGSGAGDSISSGTNNIAVGYQTLSQGSSGAEKQNTAIGSQAGNLVIPGADDNTFVGFKSGAANTSGYGNIFLGSLSGQSLTTGQGNILLGDNASAPTVTTNNFLNIGGLLFATLPATTSNTTLQQPPSGAVGIATTTPWGLFSISANAAMSSGGLSTTSAIFVIASSTAAGATSTLMYVGNSGNTGIATSTPDAALSISNALNAAAGLIVHTWTNVTNAFSIVNSAGATVFNVDTTATSPAIVIGTSTGATAQMQSVALFGAPPLNNLLFALASSSQAATTTLFSIDINGNIVTKGPVPILNACGTATVSATSTDMRGTVTVTSGTPTTCFLQYSGAKSDTPTCIADGPTSALGAVGIVAASTTGVEFGMGATFSGSIRYICLQ